MSAVYGTAARLRRFWYTRGARQRWLDVPVVSIGNLVLGGSGKTPVVAAIAEQLRAIGERPVIVSRGYAKRERTGDVVVVHDGEHLLEATARSGDEPQMLARRLAGVPVLVSPDRFRAGRLAESRFRASVLLLDDGFQHVQLGRQIDLLVVAPQDLEDRVVPAGTLREPLDSAHAADALIVRGEWPDVARLSSVLRVPDAFRMAIRYDGVRLVRPFGEVLARAQGRVVAVAGIARPQRFFRALADLGWEVVESIAFRDHHQFQIRDVRRVEDAARRTGASLIVTTEKDAVRLEGLQMQLPWAFLPLHVMIEPVMSFEGWLTARLAAARAERSRSPAQAQSAVARGSGERQSPRG